MSSFSLIGDKIQDSKKISQLLNEIAEETAQNEAEIQGVRPPRPELVEQGQKIFAEVAQARGRPLFYPFVGTGAGRGAYVELVDGSVKLDLINGIGIHIFGHSHPQLRKAALRGALSDIVMQGNLEPNKEYLALGRMLTALAGKHSRLKYSWFSTCGSMANENALKIARQKNSPAKYIVAMQDAFAGRSTMMAEVTDNPAYKQGLPNYNEVLRIPFCNPKDPSSGDKSLAALKKHYAEHSNDIACFTFEPMLGEGGFRFGSREFFLPLLNFCRDNKIAIWADEVQTFMRTGELFAFETLGFGEFVDICTIAKTLQTGATLYTEEYNPKPGLIAGTFSGSSVSLTTGMQALKMITEDGYFGSQGKIAKIHREFVEMLNHLNESSCKGLLRDADGLGLMVAATPLDGGKETVNKLLFEMFKNGLIAFSCGHDPYRLRFLLPACLQSQDIKTAGEIIERSILALAK